jgi:hypothetical protein
VRGRFRERKGAGRLEAASIECSAHWRGGEAARGGEGARGSGGGRRGREMGGRLRVEDGPDRWAPPVSGA